MDKYRRLPIFQKAEEILNLANIIAETMKEGDKKEHLAGEIVSNAMIMQVKIAGAEGGGLYSLKMQNAVLIKLAAHDMMNAVIFAALVNRNEESYSLLMREKVEEFRVVFVEWISGFDKSYDIPDNWAIRFYASTPDQDNLEDLMFNREKFSDGCDENGDKDNGDWNLDDDEDEE